MPKKPPWYVLVSNHRELQPLLPQVIFAADQERHSFGFMPARAYETVALEGKLIAAKHCDDGCLVGYIFLGGTFPQARIFQTYVAPAYRGTGVGKRLVKEVLKRCEEQAYLSVRAEVAEDLEDANRFYRDLGFKTARRKRGGEKSGRTLIVRVRELSTPSLLDSTGYGGSAHAAPSLRISTSTEAPLYLIDLNVLFDVTKRRSRAAEAGRIFAAAADNWVKIALSEEFIKELERNTKNAEPDPILELAKQLPRLAPPPSRTAKRLTEELTSLLFPSRAGSGRLTVRDISDAMHLATAIHERARGFVTSEKAILEKARYFAEEHDLDVLSPVTFGQDYAPRGEGSERFQVQLEEGSVWCRALESEETERVRRLAGAQEVPEPVIRTALAAGTTSAPRRRLAVGSGQQLIAFASWDAPRPAVVSRRAYVFVDPAETAAELALDHLLGALIRDTAMDAPSVVYLCPAPTDTLLRVKAIAFGFRPPGGASSRAGKLEKICFAAVFTDKNWGARRRALEKATGLVLPAQPPSYRGEAEEMIVVSADRQQVRVAVEDLENLLSPAVFAAGDRAAVIVPIKADYAEELFSGSTQRALLHESRAVLRSEKRYFSNRRTYRIIPESGLIVFYESSRRGGRSAAIAIARIRRRYLAAEAAAGVLALESGVLGTRSLQRMASGKQVCVTEFDHVALFKCAVPLDELKRMGCADAANVVTARAISPPALRTLLAKAFDDA